MANAAIELAVHISHTGPEHWKALRCLIGYLKGKETKRIAIRKPKVIKVVMFCDSNYNMNKETIKSVSRLVATLRGTLTTCSLMNQSMIILSSTEAKFVALSACT